MVYMTLKELKTEKEKLNKKRDELLKVANNEWNEAMRCQNNQESTSIIMKLVFSVLPYIGMITIALIARGILTRMGMSNILLGIPKLLVLPTFIIPSVIFGISLDKKLAKNKRNNEYSKMTEDEKIEKEIEHKIASVKSRSRAEVISKSIAKIEEKEKFIELNGEFYSSNVSDNNYKEREEKIDNLFDSYNRKLKALDMLSAQSVIADNFKEERINGYDKQKLLISSMGNGMLATMYTIMPFLALGIYFNGIPGLLALLGIYGVNAAIFGGYCNYRTKQKRRIFKKLNKDLGEYALEETTEFAANDERRIKREKEILIEETSKVLGVLQEERSILANTKEERHKDDTRSALEVCKTGMSMQSELSIEPVEEQIKGIMLPFSRRYAYSRPANYKSTRTERDNTKRPGILYMDSEFEDESEISQEQGGPTLVKKK